MDIDINAPATPWSEGVGGYVPIFQGERLPAEGCLADVSLRNLRYLQQRGLVASKFSVLQPSGHILVEFETGEQYLATGFGIGNDSEPVQAFCQFLVEAGRAADGEEDLLRYLYALPNDLEGEILF